MIFTRPEKCRYGIPSHTVPLRALTRGHKYKRYANRCKGVRKFFFAELVVGSWNSMPVSDDFTSLHRIKHSSPY